MMFNTHSTINMTENNISNMSPLMLHFQIRNIIVLFIISIQCLSMGVHLLKYPSLQMFTLKSTIYNKRFMSGAKKAGNVPLTVHDL